MLGKPVSGRSMWAGSASVCAGRVSEASIFAVLERDGAVLFPDVLFEDLYAAGVGRPSVPPRVVATVMVLQRLQGLSDREAVQAFEFDARWKWACGGLDLDSGGFSHSVLVDMRSRLARSERPRRLFEVTLEAAAAAGLVGHRRVLDSTPLYDAVATMDTITLVRTAIRGLVSRCKTQPPAPRPGGLFTKDAFIVDLTEGTVSCRQVSPSRSAAPPTGPAPQRSARTVTCARSRTRALPPPRDARSESGSTSRTSKTPEQRRPTLRGSRTIGRPDRRSNASLGISCAANTADAGPGFGEQ